MKTSVFWISMLLTMNVFCQKNKNPARVQRLDGVEVYILSEPLREYETVTSVTTGIKAEPILTGGLVNNSIEDDMAGYIRKLRTSGMALEGIIYSGGKSSISFKYS